jgi:UDP-N-acetylmuramoyl-L-alanyl-D-glutamate--2,6-diaminopimelate ligase
MEKAADNGGAGIDPAFRALEISGLTADSRAVGPGYLFAAIPGSQADGRAFIGQAIERGAAAVMGPDEAPLPETPAGIPYLGAANPRRRLARMAAGFYGAQPRTVAAVTGTNGKTSVAAFARQLWTKLGLKAASLGTLGVSAPGYERQASLTTPDPIALHAELAELAGLGIDHLAMEASSHGLEQYRLDGVRVSAAAFTNLTRDHLDYHGTMDDYRDAKLRLFTELMAPGGIAVLNRDSDAYGAFRAAAASNDHTIVPYGKSAGREGIRLEAATPRAHGLDLRFAAEGERFETTLPLIGDFQAMNALAAFGLVTATGGAPADAAAALAELKGAPGRVERAGASKAGGAVYVDYAHTPDALVTVLRAVRPHTQGKLVAIIGAGGDRDPGKRPLMGEAAAANADHVFVTDDNPRSEDPAAIRGQVLTGCPGADEYDDRAEAIAAAIATLEAGDILVIAGKGHEQGQTIGDTVLPFDDRSAAQGALRASGGTTDG